MVTNAQKYATEILRLLCEIFKFIDMNKLIEETKKAIIYSEDVKNCDNCKHCVERDHPHLDRAWEKFCVFSNLIEFRVVGHGYCIKFERKEEKP
jgi:hypothetical protein